MKSKPTQQAKAEKFKALHHAGDLLVLPNIWDPLGAALLENVGYKAVATASASVAFTHGVDDGENLPFETLLEVLQRIVNSVSIPVTADIESGYADHPAQLRENISRLLETGIAGINLEDTDPKSHTLFSIDAQCERIQAVREVSSALNIPLFINARTDVYIHSKQFTSAEVRLEEALKRGIAYKQAGTDGFYPILVREKADIAELLRGVSLPINLLTFPGIPELEELQNMGVARVSLGPGFLKIAIKAMKELALKLRQGDGLSEIITNEVSSDYLKRLVSNE